MYFPPVFPGSAVPRAKQLLEAEARERSSCHSEVTNQTVEVEKVASPVDSQTDTGRKDDCVNGISVVGTESGLVELNHTGPRNGHSVADYLESETEWSIKQPLANVLGYVSASRYHLYQTRAAARKAPARSRCNMQRPFNRQAAARCFEKGDQVLALLPIINNPFQARFADPYTWEVSFRSQLFN